MAKLNVENFRKSIKTDIDKDEILHVYFDINGKTWEAFFREWDWEKYNGEIVFKTGKPTPYNYKCCTWSPATADNVSDDYKEYSKSYEKTMLGMFSRNWEVSFDEAKTITYTILDTIIKKLEINVCEYHKNYVNQFSILRG